MDMKLWIKLEKICIELENLHGALITTEYASYSELNGGIKYIGNSLTLLNTILGEKIQQLIQLRDLSLEEAINNKKKSEEQAKEAVQ